MRPLAFRAPFAAILALALAAPAVAQSSADPRVGLGAGLFDAEEAISGLRKLSSTPPPADFVGVTNSDLAFKDNYAIQGNYNGVIVWDLSDPAAPELVTEYVCPASQSDVSVYGDLLFVSGEGLGGRLDCGTQGVDSAVSADRLRGIRIFDISDIREPEYVANVQTCRGSHTHSVLKDPGDDENVYIYVSGSAPVRPADELPGCVSASPDEDPETALFRIEVIQVPLDDPASARIVNSPRIFEGLTAPPQRRSASPADARMMAEARARGAYMIRMNGQDMVVPDQYVRQLLGMLVTERGGEGEPTAADSTRLREEIQQIAEERFGITPEAPDPDALAERPGPDQCHDITLYPAVGLAGGACEGYGLLLDISDPQRPTRLAAVADSNFSYWHSATFNNDATKVLFTDEWGGGGQPKCRADDPYEWGANAIFEIDGEDLEFASYYKMPAPQTTEENCVAHNGSLIPIPGRDVMVQSWYQGGISVFDWTDAQRPVEIAYHDRGPVNAERMASGGSWSVYWYNGAIVSSEIARGLDVFELVPSKHLTQNEIDAANTVRLDYLNAQGQPVYEWPPSFALVRAYVDQAERMGQFSASDLAAFRAGLDGAEAASGDRQRQMLMQLASDVAPYATGPAAEKVERVASTLRALADAG
jgi:hypothetical protein